jgi:hypothetical protein
VARVIAVDGYSRCHVPSLTPEQLAFETRDLGRDCALLRLDFGKEVDAAVRCRIFYAFQVFAAIYGYRVATTPGKGATTIFYGARRSGSGELDRLAVSSRYRPDFPSSAGFQFVKRRYAGEDFFLFFGVDEETGRPDWLGEIFEWLSCGYERRVTARDAIGRIPYAQTVFTTQSVSPRKPYAMMAMAWLQNELTNSGGPESLPRAISSTALAEHLVVCSHDIDFYFTSKSSALLRLFKNLLIGAQTYRSWPFFAWNARRIFGVLAGVRVGDYLGLLSKASREYDFQSTIFAVSEGSHRRDPNYRLEDLVPDLKACLEQGFSLGLHGSYQSIVEQSNLQCEAAVMQRAFTVKPGGTRQHWLRFGNHEKFFTAVAEAGFFYDSTLGFAEAAGFRNGACFAFPPYDFRNERAHPFLEIPLVLMDGNIEADARTSGENPDTIATEILDESRRWGWGGIAADWHNPMEPIQVPEEINQIFWKQVRNQKQNREKWISGDQFLGHCLSRYQNAGLLTDVHLDA